MRVIIRGLCRLSLMLSILLTASLANAIQIDASISYDNGSYINLNAIIPDSYSFVDGINNASTGLTFDSLTVSAFWSDTTGDVLLGLDDLASIILWEAYDSDSLYTGGFPASDNFFATFFTPTADYTFDVNGVSMFTEAGELRIGASSGFQNVAPTDTVPDPTPVSEPNSFILLSLGLAGFAFSRRRKKI